MKSWWEMEEEECGDDEMTRRKDGCMCHMG